MNEEKRREEKRREEKRRITPCQQKGFVVSGVYLTNREMDVLACVCSGYTLKNTADLLKIRETTVRYYIDNIKEKADCYSKTAVIKRFTKNHADHLIIKERLDKILNISMPPLKRCFVTQKRNIVCVALVTVLVTSTFFLYPNNKDPISYEIQLPSEQMTLPREGVITSISDRLNSKQNLNFVALIGETGIGKTTLARMYLKNNDFDVKGEIDAETENKIVQSIENLCFLLCKNGNDRAELKNIRELSNASDKRPKIKSFLAKKLTKYSNWCLIYDNATDLNALKLWLPLDDSMFKNGKIIVTTRNENIQNIRFPFEMKMIKVPYLSHREKKVLFYRINKKDVNIIDESFTKSLIDQVPSTPAGIYSVVDSTEKENDISQYIKFVSMQASNLKGENMNNVAQSNLTERQKELLNNDPYDVLFKDIVAENPKNFDMALLLCLLDSKNIRKEYFYWLGCSEDEVDEFFQKWDKRQMLVNTGDRYQIHDLIQEKGLPYLLSTLPENERKAKLNEIIDNFFVFKQIEWRWSKSDKKLSQDEIEELSFHLSSMLRKLKNIENDDAKVKLLTTLYFTQNGRRTYKELYQMGKEVIELNEKTNTLSDRDLAILLLQHMYISVYGGEFSEIEKNAKKCIELCENIETAGNLKMGAMLYLTRYYFDFSGEYDKGQALLNQVFEFKKTIKPEDWEIVKCVFASQIYRSYEAYYVDNKDKILEAIEYLKQSLKEKGFERSFRSQGAKDIPVDKNVFIMYAIEMMINVARGYNAIGYHKTALVYELDIKYMYDLLRKQGRNFCSQEFQFNLVHGETLLLKGNFKDAYEVLSNAINDKNHMSSEMDLFSAYIHRAEVLIEFERYVDAQADLDVVIKMSEKGTLPKSKRYEILMAKCKKLCDVCENPPLPKEFLRRLDKLG